MSRADFFQNHDKSVLRSGAHGRAPCARRNLKFRYAHFCHAAGDASAAIVPASRRRRLKVRAAMRGSSCFVCIFFCVMCRSQICRPRAAVFRGPDCKKMCIRDRFADDVFQSFVFYAERITAGKQYVTNLRSLSDVFDTCVDIFSGSRAVSFTRESSSGAVSAVCLLYTSVSLFYL